MSPTSFVMAPMLQRGNSAVTLQASRNRGKNTALQAGIYPAKPRWNEDTLTAWSKRRFIKRN